MPSSNTASGEIPEDVREAAMVVAGATQMPGSEGHAILTEEIARAIMAERERCAQIAEAPSYAANSDYERGIRHASAFIASSIRKGQDNG